MEYSDEVDGDEPGEGYAAEDVAADEDAADGEDAVVHEEDGEFYDGDGGDVEGFKDVEELLSVGVNPRTWTWVSTFM